MRWSPKRYDIDRALQSDPAIITQHIDTRLMVWPKPGDACFVMPTADYGPGCIVARGVVISKPAIESVTDSFTRAPYNPTSSQAVKLMLHRFDQSLPGDLYHKLAAKYRSCSLMQPDDADVLMDVLSCQ